MSDRTVDMRAKVSLPEPGPVMDSDPNPTNTLANVRLTPEERAAKKKLIVTAFERGMVTDRLAVPLPPHLHGEWIRRDPFQISHMQDLGFRFDDQYGPQHALHSDGTKKGMVADVVFMVCEREVKELIDEVKRDKFLARHAKPGERKAAEEREMATGVNADTGGETGTFVESQHRAAKKEDIAAALGALNMQTAPQT